MLATSLHNYSGRSVSFTGIVENNYLLGMFLCFSRVTNTLGDQASNASVPAPHPILQGPRARIDHAPPESSPIFTNAWAQTVPESLENQGAEGPVVQIFATLLQLF